MIDFRDLDRHTRRLERAGFKGAMVRAIGEEKAEIAFEYHDDAEGFEARQFGSSIAVDEDHRVMEYTFRMPSMMGSVYDRSDAQLAADALAGMLPDDDRKDTKVRDWTWDDGASGGFQPHVELRPGYDPGEGPPLDPAIDGAVDAAGLPDTFAERYAQP